MGVNLYIESQGKLHLIGYPDFVEHLDLHSKDLARHFEIRPLGERASESSAEIARITAALTPGCGQADIRAITNHIGEPAGMTLPARASGLTSIRYPTDTPRYIALMMDRQNYPSMPAWNWTYGTTYLYHAHRAVSRSFLIHSLL